MAEELSFEIALKDLEKTITELERGDLPLESQLKSFERGVALSRDCMKRLEEVEKRVELLMEKADGSLSTTAFDPEA